MGYALTTTALCKQYRDFQALGGLTMQVPKGAIYGFVGKNGAGKTTLIRLVCGLQKPTGGEFSLCGVKMAVICYLLSNASLIPIMLASVRGENNSTVRLLSRFFFVGFIDHFQLDVTVDQPWLTALCVAALGACYLFLALAYFKRKELK